MATKTISLDLEAYRRLKMAKRGNESFSEAIKRVVPAPFDFKQWIKTIESNPASAPFIEAVEEQISGRRSRSRCALIS